MPSKPKFTIQPVTRTEITGIDREILAKTQDDGVYDLAMAKEIRLDRIRPDPAQPRRSFDQEALDELAASIREQGVLQPIVVQYVEEGVGGYFMLTHGERRWRAAQMAGLETIPAIIREPTDDTTRLVRQLMENIQREDLNAVDRANALQALKEHLGNPAWEVVAEKVGIKRSRLFQLLDVMKQPEAVQEDIRAGRLTEKHSRALQQAPEVVREELRQAIVERSLSSREAMAIAKEAAGIIQVGDSPPGWTVAEAVVRLREQPKPAPQQDKVQSAEQAAVSQPAGSPPGWTMEKGGMEMPGGMEAPGCIAPAAVREPVTIEADPLRALEQLELLLDATDLAAVDMAPLQTLLEEIIAKASALLARLRAPLGSSDFNRPGPSPERKSSLQEPPTPTEELT